MAIINCSECGKEISDKAPTCPHCGNPLNQDNQVAHKPGDRRCLKCDFIGPMKTWLRNYNAPQFITLVLLMFWVIPGLIFIAWGWGKHKCPRCGTLGNSVAL